MSAATVEDDWLLRFHCPGCEEEHAVPVRGPKAWTWCGDLVAPTLTPSILVRNGHATVPDRRCHSFVTAGRIRYLSDCTHALAGKTVDLGSTQPTPSATLEPSRSEGV